MRIFGPLREIAWKLVRAKISTNKVLPGYLLFLPKNIPQKVPKRPPKWIPTNIWLSIKFSFFLLFNVFTNGYSLLHNKFVLSYHLNFNLICLSSLKGGRCSEASKDIRITLSNLTGEFKDLPRGYCRRSKIFQFSFCWSDVQINFQELFLSPLYKW